jgi:L-asparaginase
MDGTTRAVGAVAAVPDTLHVAALARDVMRRLPHVLLTGAGARRFADEIGMPRADMLYPDSKAVWWDKVDGLLGAEEKARFPDLPLIPLSTAITDPQRLRDTTVFLGQDQTGGLATASSTSGWAWKYPGRVGDGPIPGAGFYADSRYGACACTHTGEMTLRCLTAHRVVDGLRHGLDLTGAITDAVQDLRGLTTGFLGQVVIHAIDTRGNHRVVTLLGPKPVPYWVWTPDMAAPERRLSDLA